jgi:hypothetical protein
MSQMMMPIFQIGLGQFFGVQHQKVLSVLLIGSLGEVKAAG